MKKSYRVTADGEFAFDTTSSADGVTAFYQKMSHALIDGSVWIEELIDGEWVTVADCHTPEKEEENSNE